MDLSVIIPCYEEHECLPLLFDRITEALGTTGLSYELVFVNDGSRDQTWQLIDGFARSGRAPRVVGVDFSRNYGKEAALLAGLSHATGEVVGIMDADLQQEPQTLLAMYGELMAHPRGGLRRRLPERAPRGRAQGPAQGRLLPRLQGHYAGDVRHDSRRLGLPRLPPLRGRGASLHARVPPILKGAVCLGGL